MHGTPTLDETLTISPAAMFFHCSGPSLHRTLDGAAFMAPDLSAFVWFIMKERKLANASGPGNAELYLVRVSIGHRAILKRARPSLVEIVLSGCNIVAVTSPPRMG